MKRLLLFVTGLLLTLFSCDSKPVNYQRPVELRGVCIDVCRSKIGATPRTVAEAMHFLGTNHFNAVFPLIRLNAGMIEQRQINAGLTGSIRDPVFSGRDIFVELVHEAHRQELKIIPLIEYGIPDSLSKWTKEDSLRYRDWMMTDSSGMLLEYKEYKWLNLFHPGVRQALVNLFTYLVEEYRTDGVMGGSRLFSQPLQGVYSDSVKKYFFKQKYGELLAEQCGEPDWLRWYREESNRNIRKIYKEFKSKCPTALMYWLTDISEDATCKIVQDWVNWLNGGYADLVIPVIDVPAIESYGRTLSSLHPDSIALFRNQERIVPGIVLNTAKNPDMTAFVLQAVENNRRKGYPGEVFFWFADLFGKDNPVTQTLRQTHYLRPARYWHPTLH